jgi:succinyl-diaminopimelate desuccinylase
VFSKNDSVLGKGTLAVTRIEGGIQTNVIPDEAFFHVDMRYGNAHAYAQFMALWQQALKHDLEGGNTGYRCEWRSLLNRAPLLTQPTNPLIKRAQELVYANADQWRTVSYYTDGSVLAAPAQIPTLIYGPGDDALAHRPNESVSVSAYLSSIEFYYQLARSYGLGQWQL